MLKIILKYLFLAALIFFCLSCRQSEKAPQKPIVELWIFAGNAPGSNISAALEEFEENRACSVKIVEVNRDKAYKKLLVALANGDAPDVFEIDRNWAELFEESGYLLNLPAGEAAFFEEYYRLWSIDAPIIIYNAKALSKRGVADSVFMDFYLILEAVCEIGVSEDFSAFGAPTSEKGGLYPILSGLFKSFNGMTFDAFGSPMLTYPQNIEALEYFLSLSRCGIVDTKFQIANDLALGKIGLTFGCAESYFFARNKADDDCVKYAFLPAGEDSSLFIIGATALAANSASKRDTLAAGLVDFLSSERFSYRYAAEGLKYGFCAARLIPAKFDSYKFFSPNETEILGLFALEESVNLAYIGEFDAIGALEIAQDKAFAIFKKEKGYALP